MGAFCIDTQTVVWGVRRVATPGQEDMIDRAGVFIQQCQDAGDNLIIPAVVLAELLAGIPVEQHTDFFQTIHRRFIVAPFDGPAASLYGKLWWEHKQNPSPQNGDDSPNRQVAKADRMIAATAIAARCDALVTDDRQLANFSSSNIAVKTVRDIPIPARQEVLFPSSSNTQSQ
jgi:predicted nucleic acid-binding protein